MTAFTLDVSRVLLDVPQNSGRSIIARLARQVSRDLNVPAVGVIDVLHTQASQPASFIGDNVLLLHDVSEAAEKPYLLVARLKHPVKFRAGDQGGADLVAVLLSPAERKITDLQDLGRLTRLLRRADFIEKLKSAASADAVRSLFLVPGDLPDARHLAA